jgi:hypothetical protein
MLIYLVFVWMCVTFVKITVKNHDNAKNWYCSVTKIMVEVRVDVSLEVQHSTKQTLQHTLFYIIVFHSLVVHGY